MAQGRVNKTKLTIADGGTDSAVLEAPYSYGSSAGMMIYSPAGLSETVEVKVSPGKKSDGTYDWFDLQDGSPLADVTVPAAGTSLYYDRAVLAGAIKLVATTALASGDRDFWVSWQEIYMGD